MFSELREEQGACPRPSRVKWPRTVVPDPWEAVTVARTERIIAIGGKVLRVPRYVTRTISGRQVRVRGEASKHFAELCSKVVYEQEHVKG